MIKSPLVEQLKNLNLISVPGLALDLGCGDGGDSIALAEVGLNVVAIDKRTEEIVERKGDLTISVVTSDIRDFKIEKEKYNLIIAKNVLPFLGSKEESYQTIRSISEGLLPGGSMYLTLFGPKDAWAMEKSNMNFIDYDEAVSFLNSLGLISIHRLTEEGLGPLKSGGIKYWHIHRFLYKKP